MTTFDFPEDFAFVLSVNNDGWIAGSAYGPYRSFIRHPSGRFKILEAHYNALSISNSAVVGGTLGNKQAFLRWKKGKIAKVGLFQTNDLIRGAIMNDADVITGSFCQKPSCYDTEIRGFVAYPSDKMATQHRSF